MAKKKKFTIEVEEDGKHLKKDIIEHDDGDVKCKHNGKVPPNIEDGVKPPSGFEASKWLLSNPCYWWKDSQGKWHRYCW